ncbi:MAG: serine/threonine protein kinase [Myxococcales bacterium]|nr:serine/threonine protein kinase [Myxococcales bacterium]
MGEGREDAVGESVSLGLARTQVDLADATPTGEVEGPEREVTLPSGRSRRSGGGKRRGPATPASPRARGELVGRYVLLSELGEGGMGVVWAAYDPELDRRVALKLLRHGGDSDRLLREAQALARLAHPNVVAIYDVGVDRGEVWLAMELIAGRTLKEWLAGAGRPWREILRVLLPAGWGVAAAHEAGLIHRDLKPENLMVGDDGRVRVMDFGLARAGEAEAITSAPEVDPLASSEGSLLSSSVTRAGAILGTPHYMAPEHFAGQADERGDVFAFSVVLWEALYGERPFAGDNVMALIYAITKGTIREPPRGRRVPRWLRRVLARGLAGERDQRWPTMRALLGAIERGLAGERWRRLGALALAVVALAVAWLAWEGITRERLRSACAAEAASIAELWPSRAPAVIDAITGAGLGNADETVAKLGPRLDEWTAAWSAAREAICLDRALGPADVAVDAALADAAEDCSELQRGELEALLDLLASADADVALLAVRVTGELSHPSECRDLAHLRLVSQPDPGDRSSVIEVRRELGRIRAMIGLGKYADALAAAEAARPRAAAIGWAPLVAEAERALGHALHRAARYADAEAPLREAFRGGLRSGDEALAIDALYYLALNAHDLHTTEGGLVWVEVAKALLARGRDRPALRAHMLSIEAILHQDRGELAEAEALYLQAREIEAELYGEASIDGTSTLNNLALVKQQRGDLAGARAIHEEVQAIREATFGPSHPQVASSIYNRALIYANADDEANARTLLEQALAIQERTYGESSPAIASTLNLLAVMLAGLKEYDAAIAAGERALAIQEATYGPDAIQVASAVNNLAIAYDERGDLAKASALHQRALEIRLRRFGDQGNEVARSHTNLGEVAIKRGRIDEAIAHLEHAVELREKIEISPILLAYTRFALARALISRDPERALALAEEARAAYAAAEHKRAEEVAKWIADQGSRPGKAGKRKKRKKTRKKRG